MDLMIDLETMSDQMDAAIVAIGAVQFEANGPLIDQFEIQRIELSENVFYCNVELQSCLDKGLGVTGSTIMWWLKQSDEARKALTSPEPLPIDMALGGLKQFIAGNQIQHVWAHANFDLSILHNAYFRVFGKKAPWKYYDTRDVRTIKGLAFPGQQKVPGVEYSHRHDALYDAANQALEVQICTQAIYRLYNSEGMR